MGGVRLDLAPGRVDRSPVTVEDDLVPGVAAERLHVVTEVEQAGDLARRNAQGARQCGE